MAGIKLHKPIAIVMLAAITPLLLITLLHLDDLVSRDLSWNFGLLFLVGIVYTHFFEYGYHRVVMHGDIKRFAFIKKSVLSARMRRPACQRRRSPDPIVSSGVEQLVGGHSGGGGVSWSL